MNSFMIQQLSDRAVPTVVVGSSSWSGYDDYHCDGANDYIEVQQAIDDVASQGGGVVFLTPGYFNLNGTVKIKDYVVLMGAGTGATFVNSGGGYIYFDNSIGSRIEKVYISSNSDTIVIRSSNYVFVENTVAERYTTINNSSNVSILNSASGPISIANSSNVSVDNSYVGYVSGTRNYNVSVNYSYGTSITNSTIEYAPLGIYVSKSNSTRIDSNKVAYVSGAAIRADIGNITITNNTIHDCGVAIDMRMGIPPCIYGCYPGSVVSNNNIFNISDVGILMSLSDVIVDGNSIRFINKDGILVQANRCVIKGNDLRNLSRSRYGTYNGIELSGMHCSVIGNVIYGDSTNAQALGINETGSSDYNVVSSNVIVGSAVVEGIRLSGSNTVAIGNVIR